ncbi:phage tail spike protein [Weissella paramesenteroides]|uniref:phage tail spike protein n=1 Tax=Weissella paramesenteroides TaxID=1249 RepID=UPI003F2798B6
MIYIFDNKQKIIKVLTNEDLTAGHLDFKINTATTFEFSLPANKSLSSSAKFVAVPHPLDDSKFVMLRLTERTDNADMIDYSAYELAYQELATYGYIEDKRPAETDAKTLMEIALNESNWELNNVNVAGTAKTNFYYTDHLTAISNVVDLVGGEIVFYVEIEGNAISGRYMDYLARQGEDTSKVFAKGSNLLTIERQSDTSGIYTAILPRGKGVETDGDKDASTPDGYGRRLNIADAVWKKSSGKPLDKPAGEIILYDPTANAEWGQIDGNYRLLLETYDEIDDVNTLINSAYKTLQSVNHPKIQYSATVADVGGLSLGDTVLIMHSERDLSYKTRVFEVNYDLLDPAQTEISLGDDLSSNDITSQINSVSSSQSIASEQTQWTINQVGRNPVTFGTVAPENPKVGDTFFKYLPNGDTVVYEWNGEIWVEKVSSNISEQIDLAVEDTIETAKSQAAAMDEVRASEAAVFQSEANAALSSAAVERAVFSSNAASMANSASAHADTVANSASAYAKAQANSALSSANSELAKAKQELGSEVSKAQSDIIAANNELAGKVSQNDFDTVTRDLTTKYGQVKATADAVTADVAKYETANDKKVSANTASINALNNQITSKVSQTDFDKTTGDLSGKYSVQQQTINGISQTVTELQAKANAQGQVNQLMNTEFNPDLEGWTLYADKGSNAPYASFATYGSRGIGFNTVNADASTFARLSQTILLPSTRLSTDVMSLTWRVNTRRMDNYCHIWLVWQDVNGVSLGKNTMGNWNDSTLNKYNVLKWENISIPIDAKQVDIRFETREGTNAYIFQPMVSFTNTIGDYVPGNYNNNTRVAALELGIDHITGLVMDPKNGLSATAALAANGMTVATKAQSDATTAIQTAKGVQTTVESMGQVNHLNNSEFDPDLEGWDTSSVGKAPYRSYFDQTVNKVTVGFNTMNDNVAVSILAQTVTLASTPGARGYVSLSWQSYTNPSTTGKQTVSLGFYDSSNKIIGTAKQADWSDTSGKWPVQKIEGLAIPDGARTLQVMFYASEKVTAYLAKPMLAFEKTIGTYTPSNYNNNATVESIHTQLADQITDEIQDRTTGDKNTLQQSKDYTISQIQSATTGYQSAIEQSAEGIMASVSQVNRLFNTQFTPDLQGWNVANNGAGGFNSNFYRSYLRNGETVVGVNTVNVNVDGNTTKYYAYLEQDVALPGNNGGTVVSISWDATTNTMNNYANLWIQFKNADGSTISSVNKRWDTPVGKGWQTQKWENVSVPTNTHHIRVSFQTREGTNAYLSRPMLTFTNTAMAYMPGGYHNTDTILQLFKDNWAIGIQDNSGKLISGINGDTSNTRIVGKQITLDGNVTVTGDFYAKGGNFKNLNASNITTGTINAAKINVINLDVSSLSGNITNFIKSYWNSAYSSVKIDSSGMVVSTDSSNMAISDTGFAVTTGRSVTELSNGKIDYTSDSAERIGYTGWLRLDNTTVDYLSIVLKGWHTTKKDDIFWKGGGKNFYGGDGIKFGITNSSYGITDLLVWNSQYASSQTNYPQGWTMLDDFRHFGNEEKYGNLNLHGHFDVPGSYQALQFRPIVYNGTTYPAMMGSDKGTSGGAILFGSEEIYLKHGNNVVSLANVARKAGYNI